MASPSHVHFCPLCAWHRPAASATVLQPRCERCGGALQGLLAAELDAAVAEAQDVQAEPGPPRSGAIDAGGLLALLVCVPWLLPHIGVGLGDLVFAAPLLVAFAAADRCRSAGWRLLGLGALAGAATCAITVADAAFGSGTGIAGFWSGLAASVLLSVGMVVMALRDLRGAAVESLVDGALSGLLVFAGVTAFILVPGFDHGDPVLTAIVAVDVLALVFALVAAVTRGRRDAGPARWLLVANFVLLSAGDAIVALEMTGSITVPPAVIAVVWTCACWTLACAADHGLAPDAETRDEATGRDWFGFKVLLPLGGVLSLPVTAFALRATGHLPAWGPTYWSVTFVVALVLAFGRQAWLLGERQTAAVRERRMRDAADRRNEELEALTSLATTMTQTLEEEPIVEQALEVLRTAARATSAALHVPAGGQMALRATSGDWPREHAWADIPTTDAVATKRERGGRDVLTLPLIARGHHLGHVTLIRPAARESVDLHLLCLLVDEMAVAIQNARDYREKLEQAIRDPLTGAYNRRFMLEALEKEVQRSERYGSEASLVLFDVDDFKSINDTFGHAAGDEVLRRLSDLAHQVIRPSDSFARIGGEEFALLLPETGQMEALLVADRLRNALSRQPLLADRKVTVSGGVASVPHDAQEAEALHAKADAALYWAKRNGKDLCAVASEVRDGGEAPQAVDVNLSHLHALVKMIDAQSLMTRDHSENVASYAVALGTELGLDRERLVRLRRAAMLHDIGKVSVPIHVLEKPAKLTDDEFEQIKRHAEVGGQIVRHAGLVEESRWIRHHHERWDGAGYPTGLSHDRIPLEARIIFVADSFEAMTSDRPYRRGMSTEDALCEVLRCRGTQFDPRVVDAMETLLSEDRLAILALRAADEVL